MTTTPKARKFRIKPQGQPAKGAPKSDAPDLSESQESSAKPSIPEVIRHIESEGLSAKQLRQARRTAQRHGLEPSSDYDAVRLLREKGIDRSNLRAH